MAACAVCVIGPSPSLMRAWTMWSRSRRAGRARSIISRSPTVVAITRRGTVWSPTLRASHMMDSRGFSDPLGAVPPRASVDFSPGNSGKNGPRPDPRM
nr:MAG TPA: hypothetical protein [Caudoviricetes sp.]